MFSYIYWMNLQILLACSFFYAVTSVLFTVFYALTLLQTRFIQIEFVNTEDVQAKYNLHRSAAETSQSVTRLGEVINNNPSFLLQIRLIY
jgi:hypothetical protein